MKSASKDYLISRAYEFKASIDPVVLSVDQSFDARLKIDFERYPHLFVLCCLMDRQIPAEKAWHIPYEICSQSNRWSVEDLNSLSEEEYVHLFEEKRFHRYNRDMAIYFKRALDRIASVYNGDASKIWSGLPSSALVITRFLEFEGCGVKIATMATSEFCTFLY